MAWLKMFVSLFGGCCTIRLRWRPFPNEMNDFRTGCYPLPRINFEFQPRFCPWTVQRRQFPLRLAYATTFNSCQGLTLDGAILDIRVPVFAHGQLYTALSRVRSRHDLQFYVENVEDIPPESITNIVYQELLLPPSPNV